MVPRNRASFLLAAAAAATLLLTSAPLAAAAKKKEAAAAAAPPARIVFLADLAPLPNTTGVSLPGSGAARVDFDASTDAKTRGDNALTLSVADLVRQRERHASRAVAWRACVYAVLTERASAHACMHLHT
jgi:hypothetical protein